MQETDDRNRHLLYLVLHALLTTLFGPIRLLFYVYFMHIRHLERYGLVGTGNTCICMYIFTFLPAHAQYEFLYGSLWFKVVMITFKSFLKEDLKQIKLSGGFIPPTQPQPLDPNMPPLGHRGQ